MICESCRHAIRCSRDGRSFIRCGKTGDVVPPELASCKGRRPRGAAKRAKPRQPADWHSDNSLEEVYFNRSYNGIYLD
jgi:hypothetical protein